MRRASVFATPFTAAAAAEVAGFAPLTAEKVAHALASLADHHLRGGGRPPGRHPLPDARDDPAVRRRADGPGRRAGRRTRPTPALVPGDGSTVGGRRGVAWRVRRGGRRPAGRAGLGGRPTGVAGRRPPARRTPGTAHLRAGEAERGPGAVRGGGRAGGRPCRGRPGAPPRRGRGVGPARGQRGDPALPRRGRGGPPGRRPTSRRPRAGERGRADHERTGHHVRAGAARRGAGPAGGGARPGGR